MSVILPTPSQKLVKMVKWRMIPFVSLCCLFIMARSVEACHATFPEGDITEIKTTTKATPTTTVITSCSSAIPLFANGIPLPSNDIFLFIPGDTAAVGETITVVCDRNNMAILGTILMLTFDNGMTAQQNVDNYPASGNSFEQFAMIYTPLGLWDVSIVETTGSLGSPGVVVSPKNGIISMPELFPAFRSLCVLCSFIICFSITP